MNNETNIVADPPKSKRPKVTSVKVKTKGVFDDELVETSTIAYYTEGQNYDEYAETLATIEAISISYEGKSVNIPLEAFGQTTDPEQGFEEEISVEKIIELQGLESEGNNITLCITYNEAPDEEEFDVPMTFSI